MCAVVRVTVAFGINPVGKLTWSSRWGNNRKADGFSFWVTLSFAFWCLWAVQMVSSSWFANIIAIIEKSLEVLLYLMLFVNLCPR